MDTERDTGMEKNRESKRKSVIVPKVFSHVLRFYYFSAQQRLQSLSHEGIRTCTLNIDDANKTFIGVTNNK